jgi:pSer/pThr/pTyr-binding forkhead associated (FHA) protein
MRVKVSILLSPADPIILEVGEHLIGRSDPEAGIIPEIDLENFDAEAKVSRKHAMLRVTRNGATIEDLGSLNGTFINRKPRLAISTKHPLASGDEVAIGATFLKIEFL